MTVRREIVAPIRHGLSFRQVAARLGVSLSTVQFWVKQAGNQRLNRVNYSDQSKHPMTTHCVADRVEQCVLDFRKELIESYNFRGQLADTSLYRHVVILG
ncbi:MAG: helix-turn-helix domain-containing protein [Planctomycetaceae bacterium]|nr:helix-turn-helix domain-containing protein [Planctomycetaceae bacterium]